MILAAQNVVSSAASSPKMPGGEAAAGDDEEFPVWKENAAQARQAYIDWWNGRGLALHVTAPKDEPWEDIPPPPPPQDLQTQWLDPGYRLHFGMYNLSRTFFGGVALPLFKANIGPGSLGLMLGAEGNLAPETVWYEPYIPDPPEEHSPLRFSPEGNLWWQRHIALIDAAAECAPGRFLLSYPDLVENIDTLAQLRGSEQTLMDLIERPEWVLEKNAEINRAYVEVYEALWPRLHLTGRWEGSAFHAFQLWGPGKTAKVQCDFSCMISPAMFRRFVSPFLSEQCAGLDYAMYHLDGTQAIPQLKNLLAIDSIRAIEWTPQAGLPRGGSPQWYGLYKEIKAGGKSVQAIEVEPEEVEPLLEAVGPEGMFVMTECRSEAQARRLLERVGWGRQ